MTAATRTAAGWLRDCALAPEDARVLLRELAGIGRVQLLTDPDTPLAAAVHASLQQAAARIRAGEPLAYVRGQREFWGLMFTVGPEVLIPRPDTELLVEFALEQLSGVSAPRVLDLGTGSGAIAVAIAHARPDAVVHAVDASADALAIADGNAARLLDPTRPGGLPRFAHGDWFDALGSDTPAFDLIVGNPPYIAADDPHLPALAAEPALALVGAHPSADGLHELRRIAAAAPRWLRPGAWIAVEHGWEQAAAVRALLQTSGLAQIHSRRDLAGIERIGCARRPR